MKKQKQQAAPEFTTDADGQLLVYVALANTDQRATLYAEDYQRLMNAGFSPFWSHTTDGQGSAYPMLNAYTERGRNRLVTIARLLVEADAGKRVRYVDGNPLNLRTENLRLEAAPVRRSALDWYPNALTLRIAGIEPEKRDKPKRRRNDSLRTNIAQQIPTRSASQMCRH